MSHPAYGCGWGAKEAVSPVVKRRTKPQDYQYRERSLGCNLVV